jgi:putative methylase
MSDMIRKKRHLEMVLEGIPPHPSPRVDLEQYSTPSKIAADLLWNAAAMGDIEGLKVADLGCGTGILAIGAALLGAKEVVGVDQDQKAIDVAHHEALKEDLKNIIRLIVADVDQFQEKADTVLENPPFGAQKAHHKEADRIFMTQALKIAPVVYSFHHRDTEEFVVNFFKSRGGYVTHKFYYSFPLPRQYSFHKEELREVEVVVVRVERTKKGA